jgi:hypothetical protein
VNADQSVGATVTGLSNCVAYEVTVTATNGGGSTASDTVGGVTPRQAPGVPGLPGSPLTKAPGAVGELLFNWNAASANGCGTVSYTVEITPPPGFQCGSPAASPCLIVVGNTTTYDMTTAVPACPYPGVNCASPRTWKFRVRAANAGGTSGFSGAVSGTPRIGYRQDSVWSIWNTDFGGSVCAGCHFPQGNVLVLNDDADPSHATSWNGIRGTSGVVVLSPSPSPGTSLLHLCPIDDAQCITANSMGNPGHPGGMRFAGQSLEDNLIVQWILDGALF